MVIREDKVVIKEDCEDEEEDVGREGVLEWTELTGGIKKGVVAVFGVMI